MTAQVPMIGDRVRICYTNHIWYSYEGVIVGFDEFREAIAVQLHTPKGLITRVGCDDYEYLGSIGEGFAYSCWMLNVRKAASGPLSRWPAHHATWMEMQENAE